FCQAQHREFGGNVGRHSRYADEAVDRGDVDDGTAADLAHKWHRRADAEPDAVDVEAGDPLEILGRFDIKPLDAGGGTGVVDQYVEAAVCAIDGLHGHAPVGFAGDVESQEMGGGAKSVGNLLAIRFIDI